MALTKVQKTGITDNAIDADKIEDGTIVAADIAPGTITNAKLAGSIANDKLANSSITVNGSSVSLGGSVSAGKVEWQTVKTADFNAVAGEGYFVDTDSVGAVTATLPGSPSAGDTIAFKDYAGTFGTNALTIARNGNNIQGVANDSQISTNRASIVLVYIDATKGWLYTNESNVADLQAPYFMSATGGTITESGDFRIHTFTGDGCFVVSSLGGGGTPCAQASSIDYLVVAGGGSGNGAGGGGGGAGGFRESKDSTLASPHTASPLAATTGITVSATTYPITVGAGGGGNGSPSIFSTITSAGGGNGGLYTGSPNGAPGGSGGGGRNDGTPKAGGTGNTPPTSPSQGNPGGAGNNGPGGGKGRGGGGGGASAAGSDYAGFVGGNGGNGAGTGINPSCTVGTPGPNGALRYFAGGGGGGSEYCGGNSTGGTGGGGIGFSPYEPAPLGPSTDGTANTGGGGGADDRSGGKGIVILRYKYQ
jgi:hypothetical protein